MGPRSAARPVIAALLSVAVVVLVVLLARPDGPGPPFPPGPTPLPVSLDLGGQSLDRCAIAIGAAGLADRYPDRDEWRPLAVLFTGDVFVTLLDDEVPFACVTDRRTVQVSDPGAVVPVETVRLVLTTPGGILAAAAPSGETVDVSVPGADPIDRSRYLLRVTGTPLVRPDQLAVTIAGLAGTRQPDRLAPPALHLTDRPWESGAGPATTDDLLQRCRSGTEPPQRWQTAHVLPVRRAVLLIAIGAGAVGGCAVGPDGATPLRTWRVGLVSDGARPFTWLPRSGDTLPDLGADVAAGPVLPGVARIEVRTDTGRWWEASVAGGTFATVVPDGVAPDPRNLTVRVLDADDRVIYEGPAAD